MTPSGTPPGTWRVFGKRQPGLFLLLTAYSGALPARTLPVWLQTSWGLREEGRGRDTALSSETPKPGPSPFPPRQHHRHTRPHPREPCPRSPAHCALSVLREGRGPTLRASVPAPPTGPVGSHVRAHTEQRWEHSRGPTSTADDGTHSRARARPLPAQARSSRGLGRDPWGRTGAPHYSCPHLSSLLLQPVPAEPGSPLPSPYPRPPSVRLSAPSPVHRRYCSPPAGPCPLPRQDPVRSPGRTTHHSALPLSTPPQPPIRLPHLSVCLSVYLSICPTSFFPPSSRSLSALSVPSITSQTALPSQAVTACLSVCPPAHPSFCLPSHPSRHSHLSKLATICVLPGWTP